MGFQDFFINLVLAKRHSRDICKYEFQKWWMTTFALNLCIWQESEQKTSFRLMNWPRWRSRLANAATTWYARTRSELFYRCEVSSSTLAQTNEQFEFDISLFDLGFKESEQKLPSGWWIDLDEDQGLLMQPHLGVHGQNLNFFYHYGVSSNISESWPKIKHTNTIIVCFVLSGAQWWKLAEKLSSVWWIDQDDDQG